MLGKIFKVQRGEKYLSCTLQSLTVVPNPPEAKWHGSLVNKTSRGQLFSILCYRQGQATGKGRTRGHLAQEKHKMIYKGGLALRSRGSPSSPAADFPPLWNHQKPTTRGHPFASRQCLSQLCVLSFSAQWLLNSKKKYCWTGPLEDHCQTPMGRCTWKCILNRTGWDLPECTPGSQASTDELWHHVLCTLAFPALVFQLETISFYHSQP